MPFKSEKQKKYLFANKPSVAKKLAQHPKKVVRTTAATKSKTKRKP